MRCAHTCGSIVSFLVCLCAHGSPNIHVNLAMIVVGEMSRVHLATVSSTFLPEMVPTLAEMANRLKDVLRTAVV